MGRFSYVFGPGIPEAFAIARNSSVLYGVRTSTVPYRSNPFSALAHFGTNTCSLPLGACADGNDFFQWTAVQLPTSKEGRMTGAKSAD